MKKFRVPVTHHETGEFNRFLYETIENGIFMFNECMRDFPRELVIGKEEQFIGLHDKNGKEVYEGDIDEARGICVWVEEACRWAWQDVETGDQYGLFGIGGKLNIIGNIHENPELLND